MKTARSILENVTLERINETNVMMYNVLELWQRGVVDGFVC